MRAKVDSAAEAIKRKHPYLCSELSIKEIV
jgi:hypothetical protein